MHRHMKVEMKEAHTEGERENAKMKEAAITKYVWQIQWDDWNGSDHMLHTLYDAILK